MPGAGPMIIPPPPPPPPPVMVKAGARLLDRDKIAHDLVRVRGEPLEDRLSGGAACTVGVVCQPAKQARAACRTTPGSGCSARPASIPKACGRSRARRPTAAAASRRTRCDGSLRASRSSAGRCSAAPSRAARCAPSSRADARLSRSSASVSLSSAASITPRGIARTARGAKAARYWRGSSGAGERRGLVCPGSLRLRRSRGGARWLSGWAGPSGSPNSTRWGGSACASGSTC